ncbi:hypothetical protein [Clostridium estertheticum]|uniref:Uncharacterized protein n=1 Tax=Clostridium estertheticum TaxID=238834 RepID=A0A7Y3WUM5_9CLOT|nr:hypothetical protein [Clostridium estertheticum]NNU78165.1 hypothetical protein [Clostridium estertheticum]WBL47722.1 hypothetical protein LOR37_03265 [Clostridium estertheticum]
MEKALCHFQSKLNRSLLNTYIILDEYNYNLLLDIILDILNSVNKGALLTVDNITHKLTMRHIIVWVKEDVLTPHEGLAIYIEFKNNIIVNAEVSISL